MKKYIGTKVIQAEKMTRGTYYDLYDIYPIPEGKNMDEAGYLVKYSDGYVSWSPAAPFEKAYQAFDGEMNFSHALDMLKSGFKLARTGWNGKGMFVVYQKGYPEGIPCNKQTAEAWGINEFDLFKCDPYLQIKTVDGSHAMWVPSIRDLLANDWEVV